MNPARDGDSPSAASSVPSAGAPSSNAAGAVPGIICGDCCANLNPTPNNSSAGFSSATIYPSSSS